MPAAALGRLPRAPIALALATLLSGLALVPLAVSAQSARGAYADATSDIARFHATLEATRFRALLDADWDWRMQDQPENATRFGDHRYDDRLTDESPAANARREAHARDRLAALKKIDRAVLVGEDRISLDFALQQAQVEVDYQRYPGLRTQVLTAMAGVQIDLPELMRDLPVRNEADARNALARLRALPARIAQDVAWLREGKRLGWVTFKASLSQVPAQIDGLLAEPPGETPLLAPFRQRPAGLPQARAQALADEAAGVLRDQVLPAYQALRKVVVDELLPVSPENGALGAYPDGEAVYRLKMHDETTLTIDAKTVHALGLSELARLQARLDAVMRESGFDGTRAEFVDFLGHDPRFFYTSPDELLAGYRDIAKRVDPELTRLFLVLPRTPYGIRAIPAFQGANAAEFYTSGAADASSPGWFNANVVALAQRPKWEMEDLLLHEGVPGHHLQISRAHELVQLPMFRRTAEPTAYEEGWALYCEGLGSELGLYKDPYSRYGQLHAEAFRAARLVVDTGIHALGWTRQQAIDFMVDQGGQAREDATSEVDRDYVMPAQALGYKLGQMKILALRAKATAELGDRFDLRAFHQELLDHGPLPLPVLEQVIVDWIARVQRGNPGAAAP